FQNSVRNEDTIARIGGDEFVGVLQNTDANGAMKVAHKLLNTASKPVCLSNTEVQVSASIGVAIYPDHAQAATDLLICSDNFMYIAKDKGKNKIVMGDRAYE
ncbi:MAG: GGDEF domain-containing protein, partial [Neptuniibacter sp.]